MAITELTCDEVRTAHRHEGLRVTALTLLKAARYLVHVGDDPELDMLLREMRANASRIEQRVTQRWVARGGLG